MPSLSIVQAGQLVSFANASKAETAAYVRREVRTSCGIMSSPSCDILLIEDSEADRVLIEAMLADGAHDEWRVVTCRTLAEGLTVLRSPDSVQSIAAERVRTYRVELTEATAAARAGSNSATSSKAASVSLRLL